MGELEGWNSQLSSRPPLAVYYYHSLFLDHLLLQWYFQTKPLAWVCQEPVCGKYASIYPHVVCPHL